MKSHNRQGRFCDMCFAFLVLEKDRSIKVVVDLQDELTARYFHFSPTSSIQFVAGVTDAERNHLHVRDTHIIYRFVFKIPICEYSTPIDKFDVNNFRT